MIAFRKNTGSAHPLSGKAMLSEACARLIAMNPKGHPPTLVATQTGNTNAVTFGVHSRRLIEQRARELVDESVVAEQLDEMGKFALKELARLTAVIEAIDHDLSVKGVSDRNGKERYLVARRERYSRRLMELSDRVLEAQARSRKQAILDPSYEVVGERSDYIRAAQLIALGHDPHASVPDQLKALKLVTDLGHKGTTSYFKPKRNVDPYLDDPEIGDEVAALHEDIAAAKKRAHLERLRREEIDVLADA
jgi:hypothetical protein